jgi:hypothetical protein
LRPHAIQWRYEAEDLVRLRRSTEQRRFTAPQRVGRIDPNPHQIEAVVFALSRLNDGGCILADEVGLGKTIEAGLVIAQLWAEGARRILLVAPKPLLGQWRQELYALFGIEAKDGATDAVHREEGVFLIGRERAGGEHGRTLAAVRFDLIVIDEAHEIFGGLYKRIGADGEWREDAQEARTAWRAFELIRASGTPVLLLTATPIQNSLTELWALVQYVDPSGTLLGQLRTFRELFCDQDDRVLTQGQEDELRRRIGVVLKRTLRRQAQEFLSRPFVNRQAKLFEYRMSPAEAQLYEDVTRYLLEPNLAGFRGNNRRLLLIAFHRRMSSSSRALAQSLDYVAERLRRIVDPTGAGAGAAAVPEWLPDGADEEEGEASPPEDALRAEDLPPPRERVQAELARVLDFSARARALGEDSKARALLEALRLVLAREKSGRGSGKLVVFTEYLVTQDYLQELLIRSGLVGEQEVTLFRGTNDSARARQALERWWKEVGGQLPPHTRPAQDIAIRLALVHEFATRSRVLISTEAGAKGLNLQFSETVVNYDLPWNPQRIEQRIGRCHRYGQTRDVTVINFTAKDNAADRLLFEILSQKLDLFGTVLDASDRVLHEAGGQPPESLASALGAELEASLRRIWERARTVEEVETELRQLREKMGEERRRFEDQHSRTAGLIESHFDDEVRRVFRRHQEQLRPALAELDADLERVAVAYLRHLGAEHRVEPAAGGRILTVHSSPALPASLRGGLSVALGAVAGHESLHLNHPLIAEAVAAARAAASGRLAVALQLPEDAPPGLRQLRGTSGRLVLLKVRHGGLEPVEHLVPVALLDGVEAPLAPELAAALLRAPARDVERRGERPAAEEDALADAIEEAVFADTAEVSGAERARLERNLEQIERYVEDRLLLLRRKEQDLERRLERQRERRDQALGADVREEAERAVQKLAGELESVQADAERLARRDDRTYQQCRERLSDRGHAPVRVDRLFDVEITIE